MSVRTATRGIVSLIAIGAVITAGVMFAGRWHTPNGKDSCDRPDEPRTLTLSVTWEPTPRKKLVAVYYTVNGVHDVDMPLWTSTISPYGRLVTITCGDSLLLQTDQLEPGALTCRVARGRVQISENTTDLPGHLECGAPALF